MFLCEPGRHVLKSNNVGCHFYRDFRTLAQIFFWACALKPLRPHLQHHCFSNIFIAAIPAPRKFRMIFYNFCYYFWGQHCWWTETNIIGNDFFYMFALPSTVLLLPLPYRTIARKFSIGGLASVQGGLTFWNLIKLHRSIVLHNSIWGLGALFVGDKLTKAPRCEGTTSLPLHRCPWICMLCQQTPPKRWFANVNMTSYYDVTNNVFPVTMTTIRHCSILEFGRGASNQAVARASPDLCMPLHPLYK